MHGYFIEGNNIAGFFRLPLSFVLAIAVAWVGLLGCDSDIGERIFLIEDGTATQRATDADTLNEEEGGTEPYTNDGKTESGTLGDSQTDFLETDTHFESEPKSEVDSDSVKKPENTLGTCSDDADNDGDGLMDCEDLECLSTKACECLSGDTKKEHCGDLCGEAEVTCIDGRWGPPGECEKEGDCRPGDELEEECDVCRVKKKVCKKDCKWGKWERCKDVPGCVSCEGVVYDDLCWYFGELGESCKDVCEPHGGYSNKTPKYVGTYDQGGSLKECQALFDALGYEDTVSVAGRSDGKGLGCHSFRGVGLWWLVSPDFNPSHSNVGARLVCACEK